jgi:hypothetical protein
MGFANPFLYDTFVATPAVFTDVTQGNNNIYSSSSNFYRAVSGYDPATGVGSPDAWALAQALALYAPGSISQTDTVMTISTPATAKTIYYGNALTFSGDLVTSPGNVPVANRRVYLELAEGGYLYVYVASTDSNGHWSLKLSKGLRRNLTWSVNFPGSDTQKPSKAVGHAIHVIPHLGSASSATSVRRGVAFTFHGASLPNMHGVKVQLQARRSTSAAWRTLKLIAVANNGTYSVRISVGSPGPLFLRWRYAGGVTRPWMSAVSPPRRVNIT